MGVGDILSIGRQSLVANSRAISSISSNISNANTEGYSRRRTNLVATDLNTDGLSGSGVAVQGVVRIVDRFINANLIDQKSARAFAESRQEFLERLEPFFPIDGATDGVGGALNDFFSSFEDLATNPSSIPLRTQVLQKGESLVTSIRGAFNAVAGLQRDADTRLGFVVGEVNRLSGEIAELNSQISLTESTGQEALTFRDSRDQLLRDLGELISIDALENPDGNVLVTLSNGFALVNGANNRELELSKSPSFEANSPNGFPVGLDGAPLGKIVHDFGTGGTPNHFDLTAIIRAGQGEMGGLLALRGTETQASTTFDTDGDLVAIASRLEALTRDLLTRVNQEYLGPDGDTGTAGFQPSATDLDGNTPDQVGKVAGIFALFSYDGANLLTGNGDQNADGVPTSADLDAIITSGTGNVTSFARLLNFNVDVERELAAGRDQDLASSTIVNATGSSANIDGILSKREETVNYSIGGFSINSITLGRLYQDTVSQVASTTANARNNFVLAEARETQVEELQASVSGVSLDEEFASLILFQRSFEGAARLIRTADELLETLLANV